MAKVIGNGLTATLGGNVTIAVTSVSLDSAERPVVDITAAADSQRQGIPGLRGVSTGSLTGILQDAQITVLEAELDVCDAISLAVTTKHDNCTTVETLMNADVHVTGFTIDASIDEAVTVTVNFMLAAGEEFI